MKKNDIIKLEITGMTAEGNGVGRADNGMAVFVPLTAVGDAVLCRIVKLEKSLAYGIIEEITTASPDREESCCDVSAKCGGCTFRHISYDAELKIKSDIVYDAVTRLGKLSGFELEKICGGESDRYRNKAQYPFGISSDGKIICGFFSKRSHRVIAVDDCILQPKIFSDIAQYVTCFAEHKKLTVYNEESGNGNLRHLYLRRGFHSGEIMVCIVAKSNISSELKELSAELTARFPKIKSVILNINPDKTNVILGSKNITILGGDTISDTLCGNKIELSPMSFYQVNTAQAERLYDCAKDYAALTGNEVVLDLYCGAGTIGLSFADKAKKIIGCEIVPEAIENAKKNALQNSISNAEFYCGDAGKLACKLAAEGIKPDVIVIDPPRKGCDLLTLDSIIKMSPSRVVMVSCNPATAARDAKYLSGNGYSLFKLRPFDLFPRTSHVETVVLMSKVEK